MVKYSEPLDNDAYYSDDPFELDARPPKRKIPAIFGSLLLLIG